MRLDAARREMVEAVQSEDYESAARLRDLIRNLEGQIV
jgi:protein-arginine kinase activator protein McsA